MYKTQSYIEHRNTVYLQIGDIAYLGNEGKAWTVLGSCVSVCLYSKEHKVSVVCHAQLPKKLDTGLACYESCPESCLKGRGCTQTTRYLEAVVPKMVAYFSKKNIPIDKIKAALLGGASTLNTQLLNNQVGRINSETARSMLKSFNIPVVFDALGGKSGVQILFDNQFGMVYINKKHVFTF